MHTNERGGVEKMSGVITYCRRAGSECRVKRCLTFRRLHRRVGMWRWKGESDVGLLCTPFFSGRFCAREQGWQYVLTGLVEGDCPAS